MIDKDNLEDIPFDILLEHKRNRELLNSHVKAKRYELAAKARDKEREIERKYFIHPLYKVMDIPTLISYIRNLKIDSLKLND